MKKLTFDSGRGFDIVADYYAPKKNQEKNLIIMLHGFASDRYVRGIYDVIAASLNAYGYAVLKYDAAGCGQSGDEPILLSNQVNDLKMIIDKMCSEKFEKIVLLGHSMGGLVCLKSYNSKKIRTMIFLAPLMSAVNKKLEKKRYNIRQLFELFFKGYMIKKTKHTAFKSSVKVDVRLIDQVNKSDFKGLLKSVKSPILIFHGDADKRIDYNQSKKAMKYLPKTSRLEIIPGDRHFLENSVQLIIEKTLKWLGKYL